MEKKRYDAFISYRHCETDSFVAKTLEKKLETLKLPKNIQSTTNITKIDRIFRDEDELPVATNLSDQIEYALKESEYLICLCSPRYLESKWCMKEIETFIGLYGREKILLVLVDGEPNEAFPELLTKEDVKEIDENGNEIIKTRYIEPLAADVRGKDNKERKKKIEDTTLRLSAAMLGINYDDLKQRHRERKLKQTMSAITVAFVCMLIFSLTCLGMLLRIQKQSLEIQAQSSEIQKQSSEILKKSVEIEEKNVEIEAQYKEISTKFAISTAENCLDLLDKGRKADAVYALRQVLPNSIDDTDIPFTPEAQFMLSDALDLYPKELVNYSAYEFNATLSDSITNGVDYVGIIDESHSLYLFNLNDNRDYSAKVDLYNYFDHSAAFIDEDNVVYQAADKSLVKYNVRTNEAITLSAPEEPDPKDLFSAFTISPHNYVFTNLTSEYYAVSYTANLDFYDKATDSVAFTINLEDYLKEGAKITSLNGLDELEISENSKYAVASIDTSTGKVLLGIDLETKEKLFYEEFESLGFVKKIKVDDEGRLLACISVDSNVFQCIDLNKGKVLWERDDIGLGITDFFYGITLSGTDCVTVISYDKFYFLDTETGETVLNDYVDEQIVLAELVTPGKIFVMLRDGTNFYYIPEVSTMFTNESFSHSPNMAIEDAFFTQRGLVIVPSNMNYISFYKFAKEVGEEIVYELTAGSINSVSNDLKYYITREYDDDFHITFNVYETETNNRMLTIKSDNGDLYFDKNDSSRVILASYEASAVYSVEDASKLFSINTVDDFSSTKKISADGTLMYSYLMGIFNAYSLTDGQKIGEITFENSSLYDRIYVAKDNTLIVMPEGSPNVDIYDIPTGNLLNTVYVGADYSSNQVISDDGKYFYISFPNGTRNIYTADKNFTKLNTLYEDYEYGEEFKNVLGTDMYLFDANYDYYLMNGDFKPIMYLDFINILKIDVSKKLIYVLKESYSDNNSYIIAYPYYDYNDLVKLADEYLGDYYPSEAAREQYNILQ